MHPTRRHLEERVRSTAEAALEARKYVTPLDILLGLGWLPPSCEADWRQGRVQFLEAVVNANLHKISEAMSAFRRWAVSRGLRPIETAYVARGRDRRALRFSRSGDGDIERAYRTHWVSPELSEKKQERLQEKASKPPDLVVIQPLNSEWKCTQCGETGDLLIMEGPGPLCLTCAEMDHLVFLGAGNATLSRRAKKGSRLSAVVVRFSRSRGRYERQGILVEEDALAQAEASCTADAGPRAERRIAAEAHRRVEDAALASAMAERIRELFPGCPPEEAAVIARHTSVRSSGRVGRSAAGRALDEGALDLAVRAAVRHRHTRYDDLLMQGTPRTEARESVQSDAEAVIDQWRQPPGAS